MSHFLKNECTKLQVSIHPREFNILCRDVYDSYMILSFIGETRVLGMNMEEELDEIELNGVDTSSTVCLNLTNMYIYMLTHLNTNFATNPVGIKYADCLLFQLGHEGLYPGNPFPDSNDFPGWVFSGCSMDSAAE